MRNAKSNIYRSTTSTKQRSSEVILVDERRPTRKLPPAREVSSSEAKVTNGEGERADDLLTNLLYGRQFTSSSIASTTNVLQCSAGSVLLLGRCHWGCHRETPRRRRRRRRRHHRTLLVASSQTCKAGSDHRRCGRQCRWPRGRCSCCYCSC